ncbi:MAG: 1,4-dihydroxy-2-naphthoate octaprenyltransferase [Crocinitomicaceae bacterium]|nr:1,4-dihydroxy-2-naphthoate octaprenyltransferase [Crocinitomicaceae bacterium]
MIKSWLKAFRLRTLPLSMSGIILGSFLAKKDGFWDQQIFMLAMFTTLFFQVLSNLANDLGDSQKGTDNENRIGPMRSVQSGEISMHAMKTAVWIFSILSFLSAVYLIYISSQGMTKEVVLFYGVLAVLCILAAITYTVGKRAYGYSGFGDVFVFIFFGLVSVLGSYTLYTKQFNWKIIFPAITIGMLSTAVLNLNNMRDQVNDKAAGKITLVVKLGKVRAKYYHYFLILSGIVFSAFFLQNLGMLRFLFLIPYCILTLHLNRVKNTEDEKDFDPELKKVALTTFLIALLYAVISSLSL